MPQHSAAVSTVKTWSLKSWEQICANMKTRWARVPKSKTAHSAPFFKILWCGQLCSARNRRKIFTETSRALMVSGVTIHHSMLCQLRLHSSSRYLFLGSRLVCFAAGGARTKRGWTEHRAKWKLNNGGSWPKEHENEDVRWQMVNDHEKWDMMKDE